MQKLIYFYFALAPFTCFAPILILIVAMLIVGRMSKYKWLAHVFTLAAMFFTFPVFVVIGWILDPTLFVDPAPGGGFFLLFYLVSLLFAVLIYSSFAWVTRHKSKAVESAL
jgi:hypothetical protein